MFNGSEIRGKIKANIERFCSKAKERVSKPTGKFIHEMLHGILTSQSVLIIEIARSLGEGRSLQTTENRIANNLAKADIEQLNGLHLKEVEIDDDTIFSLDPGDISKEYAKKYEHLDTIRDGDTGLLKKGYHLVGVVASKRRIKKMDPCVLKLYSTKTEGYKSENEEIREAVEQVDGVALGKGLWVIDRGGDRQTIFDIFLGKGRAFLIRMTSQRHLMDKKGIKRGITGIAQGCKCRLGKISYKRKGVLKVGYVGTTEVKLPWSNQQLILIVIKNTNRKVGMMLLTTKIPKGKEEVIELIGDYIQRWDVEEYYRFIKQQFDYENIRVRSYRALQSMTTLVLIASKFIAQMSMKLKWKNMLYKIYEKAKRLGKIAKFDYYTIADGIAALLRQGVGFRQTVQPDHTKNQLEFGFASHFL